MNVYVCVFVCSSHRLLCPWAGILINKFYLSTVCEPQIIAGFSIHFVIKSLCGGAGGGVHVCVVKAIAAEENYRR